MPASRAAMAMRSARPNVLFEWSERARQFNHRIVPVRPPPDPEVAAVSLLRIGDTAIANLGPDGGFFEL